MKTSSKPIKTTKALPPHEVANVGPGSVAGQLQFASLCNYNIMLKIPRRIRHMLTNRKLK